MSARPLSGLATVEAGELLCKLDSADEAETLKIVGELRALLNRDESSFQQLGMRLISPPLQIMYLRPTSKSGSVEWDKELRAEAASYIENYAWKDVRTIEEHRKITDVLAALKSKKGRMTFDQARIAENIIRVFREPKA